MELLLWTINMHNGTINVYINVCMLIKNRRLHAVLDL